MTYPKEIVLGFDFYGAGNIGDDCMLSGLEMGIDRLLSGHFPQRGVFYMSC